MQKYPPPILQPDPTTGHLVIREACGLNHERQILTVACDAGLPDGAKNFSFRDVATGREFPAQRSHQDSNRAFLQIELRAHEEFQLVAQQKVAEKQTSLVALTRDKGGDAVITNGKWSASIFLGKWNAPAGALPGFEAPAPIRRVRIKDGPWRGNAFFDTREPVYLVSSTILEDGPLRFVTQFHAKMGDSHFYMARLTFDAGSDFIRVDESFDAGSGDQIVWDFPGADLPREIHLLDSTAGFTTLPLHYFFDRRLARLACWNQYSQLHDFSDGYAFAFSQNDVAGFIALSGGDWRGNSHNFMEAWTRRWFPSDPASRRSVPPEAKADAAPSPERIDARGGNSCEPHFSVEGWIHQGNRSFALLLTSKDLLRNPGWKPEPPHGHFETSPDRERYRRQQSLPRRIHTQHGMFPLQDQLAVAWSWPVEKPVAALAEGETPWGVREKAYGIPNPPMPVSQRVEEMLEFLEARVFGFWEGSGAACTNAAVSRRLAHDLADFEWLAQQGHLDAAQTGKCRAWFVFLASLFSSDHYYPGAASMNMGDPQARLEPSIAGMANQNFFTDVFNMPGMAAQVFSSHPNAVAWRERFAAMWKRQLEYHVYPESGVWEESHSYFHHVLQTVLPTLDRRRDDGLPDGYAEPVFQRLAGSLLKLLSPKDACFGGKRHVVTLGDHGVDPKDLYRLLYRHISRKLAASNSTLAAQLEWAYLELGGEASPGVKPEAVSWQNEYVRGLGYFFRSRDSRGESLMVLRCGNSWGHHHNDEGSLQFFGAGRAWIVDSAFSFPQLNGARKFRAEGHSRWMPRDISPLDHLWQFNRGWITSHQEESPYPHAVAFTPVYMAETAHQNYALLHHPILHWRGIVQLSPTTYLIMDRSNTDMPQCIRFHVPLDASIVLEDAATPGAMGSYLRMQSLAGLQPPRMNTTDYPVQDGERFATREILYEVKDSSFAAMLVVIGEGGMHSVPKIEHEEGLITLRHPGLNVELDISAPGSVQLRGKNNDVKITIPLGGEVSA